MDTPNTPALDLAQLEGLLEKVADRDGDTDSPLPVAINAVLKELNRLRDAENAAAPALLAECRRLHCELEDAHQERVSFRDGCEDAEAELTRQRAESERLRGALDITDRLAGAVDGLLDNLDDSTNLLGYNSHRSAVLTCREALDAWNEWAARAALGVQG